MMNNNVPASYLPRNYNRKNVMNETNGSRYDCKYVNDEIFISTVCVPVNYSLEVKEDNKEFNKSYSYHNVQNAFVDNGKFYFDFPSIWYNSNSVNKAIGVRSIDVHINPLLIRFMVFVTKNLDIPIMQKFYVNASSTMSTEDIVSQMAFLVNGWFNKKFPTIPIVMTYTYKNGNVIFETTFPILDNDTYSFSLSSEGGDFNILFQSYPDYVMTQPIPALKVFTYTYKNVWNRRDVFLHASFVNYTSFNYLGKNGEFYPKISKIYDFNVGTANNFYFEISIDGIHPIPIPIELGIEFRVGLCFIVDDKKYNGE